MKISTKGRYGLRVMLDLAVLNGEGPIPLRTIAMRQNISEKYSEQIITQLHRIGLVQSFRGAQGGYLLATDPQNITVGQILRALEGSMAPVYCVGPNAEPCEREDYCVTVGVWRKIRDAVDSVIDTISLQDLVNDYEAKNIEDVLQSKQSPDGQ